MAPRIPIAFLLVPLLAQSCVGERVAVVAPRSQPHAAALAITDRLGADYGIAVVHRGSDIPKSRFRPRYATIRPEHGAALLRYARILDAEFRKYPVALVRAAGLRTIVLVRSLRVGLQRRTAMPDYLAEALYLDIEGWRGHATYMRHVLHHEFFHLLEEQVHGDIYYKDPKWQKLNSKGFRYGRGGARMRQSDVARIDHPRRGFVSRYATSGLEEDKAEVWAVMFVAAEWQRVRQWLLGDDVLRHKVAYLQAFAARQAEEMDAGYWRALRRRATSRPTRR